MLTLYRRHNPTCSKAADRYWKRCTCPMWAEGVLETGYVRQSLKTKSWERAVVLARGLESASEAVGPADPKKSDAISIAHAVQEYLADAKARGLSEATV